MVNLFARPNTCRVDALPFTAYHCGTPPKPSTNPPCPTKGGAFTALLMPFK